MGMLDEKVVVVTGAGRKRGIGRAIALRLAQDGAHVVVSSQPRDPSTFPENEKAERWQGIRSVVEEIRSLGRRAIAIDCDITRADQVQALIDAATHELGGVDGLVNNAGIPSGAGSAPIVEMDDELWYRTVDVNLNGVYLASKAAARAMIRTGKAGAIVNISSTAGRMGFAEYGAYCATKFAMIGLTQQMALELAKHSIRVNCVCPGSTDTDMMDGTFRRTAERAGTDFTTIKSGVRNFIPMSRQARAEEQAAVVAFLVGPDASYMTGQTLNVDGGLRMD
jgi:3-oxoacyl-[acyl-carrier protein] reductase/meso-butanediol dehydrogenase/(S,S)-butanediol dehydrogenase/diacetyl reductase